MSYRDDLIRRVNRWRIREETKRGILVYYDRLVDAGLPVIFDLYHLGHLTSLEPRFLGSVVERPHDYYREYKIPKRRGGYRTILAPRPYLAHAQRWVLSEILRTISAHPAASAFSPGKSVAKNAAAHAASRTILKMDVRDFFGSISRDKVEAVYAKIGYSPKVSFFLSRISTAYGRLPQGAPTSPHLSNILLRDADSEIAAVCRSNNLLYTRYADDISISGDEVDREMVEIVTEILFRAGLDVADDKTIITRKGRKQIVTGVSVSSGVVKLPRATKRRLRQEIHYVEKFGIAEHRNRVARGDPIYAARLDGKVGFWLQIEPENAMAMKGKEILRRGRKTVTV